MLISHLFTLTQLIFKLEYPYRYHNQKVENNISIIILTIILNIMFPLIYLFILFIFNQLIDTF